MALLNLLDGILLVLLCGFTSASTELSDIQVRYGIISNNGNDNTANLTLINAGNRAVLTGNRSVSVYMCFIRPVVNSTEQGGVILRQSNPVVTAYHLDGCAHKVVYSTISLEAGETLSITLIQMFWTVAYSDVMPNWYIRLSDGPFHLIANTDNAQHQLIQKTFVDPFDSPEKYLRSSNDKVKPWTMSDRYYEYRSYGCDYLCEEAAKSRLIPAVTVPLPSYGSKVPVGELAVVYRESSSYSTGEHSIEVTNNHTVIITTSSDNESKQQAKATYTQLIERNPTSLAVGRLYNKPRFGYRGFMLDLARHFLNADSIKRQIKLIARYKLNYLHLHISDDESWALEIDGIPELTMYGSKQCFDVNTCATYPQLGRKISDPRAYLTKQEYIDIIRYAASLGVTILPEIELPGHSTAAINAMKIRHRLSSGSVNYVDYRLHDPNDESKYESVQFFTQGAMNPCVNSTFNFLTTVIQRIKEYHQEAGQPLKLIHLAGDEVANGAWVNSSACQAYVTASSIEIRQMMETKKPGFTDDDYKAGTIAYIKSQMLRRLGEIAESEQLDIGFWEDGIIDKVTGRPFDKQEIFPRSINVYAFVWQTVWEWWGGDRAFRMANNGYKVVMTPATRYYLDHHQEPNSNENGYYWASRFTNMRKAFAFRPINYYANIDGTRVFGDTITREQWCNPDKCPPLNAGAEKNIVGVEAPLFGETISTDDHIDNNAWPRLLAVAKRAWNEAAWEKLNGSNPEGLEEDFQIFQKVINEYERPWLNRQGVKYHIAPPGAVRGFENRRRRWLAVNTEYDGELVCVRYENSRGRRCVTRRRLARFAWLTYNTNMTAHFSTMDRTSGRYSYEVECGKHY